MRFQVPQFIEHEPKIIGPLTFKQFIYLGVPAAIAFFLYFLAPLIVFAIATIFLGMFGFLFAFIKVGGRDMSSILLSVFHFAVAPKRYIWRKRTTPLEARFPPLEKSSVAKGDLPLTKQGPQKREIQLTKRSKVKDLAMRVETNK